MAGEPIGHGTGVHTVYATEWPAIGESVGRDRVPEVGGPWRRNTANAMQKVREGVRGFVQEGWVPFTSAIYSRFIGPRPAAAGWQSAMDLDSGLRITRFGSYPSSERPFPYPYEIGAVSGFMPMLDQYSIQWAWARPPSGPGVLTPIPAAWQITYPQLQKVTG